jgi:hypothetical protein
VHASRVNTARPVETLHSLSPERLSLLRDLIPGVGSSVRPLGDGDRDTGRKHGKEWAVQRKHFLLGTFEKDLDIKNTWTFEKRELA